jgi:hypothetical protein
MLVHPPATIALQAQPVTLLHPPAKYVRPARSVAVVHPPARFAPPASSAMQLVHLTALIAPLASLLPLLVPPPAPHALPQLTVTMALQDAHTVPSVPSARLHPQMSLLANVQKDFL